MTPIELNVIRFMVVVMLLVCAFSKSWTALVIRFVFFSLLVLFLGFVFYQ